MSGSPPALSPSPLTLAILNTAAASLVGSVQACAEKGEFEPLIRGVARAVEVVGVLVDRVQLPLARTSGFRHPVYNGILATWQRGSGVNVRLRRHAESAPHQDVDLRELLSNTPYYALVFGGQDSVREDLTAPSRVLSIYAELAEQGYVDYLAVGLPLPDGRIQLLSLAARTPMPADAAERMFALRPTLALAIYGAYSASAARQVATTYIGQNSGLAVLSGDIVRGETRSLEAGILFADLRGFTRMTQTIGAAETVAVLNAVFEVVGAVVEAHGGEILKFIGDAMLAIFPITEARDRTMVADALVSVAMQGTARVAALPQDSRLLGIGFGGHIGRVLLGNIGTTSRLDFTVIGPAVNLASRLERLCSTLSVSAVFSEAVAAEVPLELLEKRKVKGVDEPVEIFGHPSVEPQRSPTGT
ncbi:MAG: adenylate/guanylate cyclase domain-containing protein [Myxococcota bacterium]|nr:adenylate/guanylate cyclase domain-containing protein [Myxococcota bacterium]